MATTRENLQTRLTAVAQQIAELSAANYDLPNATGPDAVDMVGKIAALYDEYDRLEAMIARSEGGFEIPSEADLQ